MPMRLLAACRECKRQYDASTRKPGSVFHCACGATVTVPKPEWQDAAVVRCAECGAPRERGVEACSYCGASFTLHERDMHTICPECMARVSDKARYCHRCATAIMPEGDAGQDTDKACPVCGDDAPPLVSRALGEQELSVLECGSCGGLWLGSRAFRILEDRAREKERDYALPGTEAGPSGGGSLKQQGPMYRPCVECGQLMARRNYARKSGVIIDVCRDHGMFFDAGELARILHWIREGGLSRTEALGRLDEREELRRQRVAEATRRSAPEPYFGESRRGAGGGLGDFLDGVFDFLG